MVGNLYVGLEEGGEGVGSDVDELLSFFPNLSLSHFFF